jgi:TonB-dependent receptor
MPIIKNKVSLRFYQVFVLILVIFFNVNNIKAQSGSGTLTGKIINNDGEPLPGANVYMEGTAIGAASDIEGNYRIKNIPSGKHKVIVSYVGYGKKTIEITIVANKTTDLNVTLQWGSENKLGEVVVTGQLEGQAQAINQQLSSDQIVNVVSEQKIKELPDANAAEAVGRLPGVAVQREGGEATKLMIRGLDPKFAKISINGIEIPSTGAETRDVDLSLISQSTLSGIELYKALTPDQDADAIAGTVNLEIGKAESDQKIKLNVFGIYSGLTKSARQYRLSGQYNNRFLNGLLGLQAGANVEKRNRSRELHTDAWNVPANGNYTIGSLTVQFDDETRKRYGGNLNLDLNTGDGGNIKLINLYSYTSRGRFTSNRNYPTGGGTVTYIGEATDLNLSTLSNSLIGENHWGALKINWALAHAYTESHTPFDHTMRFYENSSTTTGMMNITDPNTLKLPGKNLIQYAFNAFDKATLDRGFFHTESNDERNYNIKADLEYPINLNDNLVGSLKAGYKFKDKIRHRNYNDQESIYYLRGIYDYTFNGNGGVAAKDWADSPWPNHPNALLTDYLSGPPYPTRTIDKDYLLNPLINEDLIREWYQFNKNGTNQAGNTHEYYNQLSSVRNIYSVDENVNATYAMLKLNVGRFASLIAGMRYEFENNNYTAKFAPRIVGEFEAQSGTATDTISNYRKEYWLPNVHLKISPLDWLDLRFAVTKSISRPDYLMRLPTLYISTQDQAITSGNPNLESAVSWNYDANVSFYTTEYGLLTISGFRKNIDNIFYWLNNIKLLTADQARGIGLPVDKYGPFNQYNLDMPVNTSGTKVWGYELDLQAHLGFLPGLLKNIVISANYSRIWSKTIYPRFRLIQPAGFPPKPPIVDFYFTEKELSGQTNYTANLTVGYDYLGFSFRLSGYFQGPYLSFISNIEDQDQYQKAFSRWDLAFKQSLSDNLSVFLNLNNLSNTIEGGYLSFRSLDSGGYLYGITAELGVQVSLL